MEELPVLPAVVVRLMGLDAESEQFFEDVLNVASEDPGLALRVISIANSASSAPRAPVDTLQGAVVRLGATHVAELVTSVAITRVFVPRSFGERDLWHHAIEVATACRALIRRHPVDGVTHEQAYLAGLLHDVGRFVLFDQAPEFIQEVDDLAWTTPDEMVAAERNICGIDHADLGGQVCSHWSVPDRVVAVVRYHHGPLDAVSAEVRGLLETVKLADWLSIWHRHHDDEDDMEEGFLRSFPSGRGASGAGGSAVEASELMGLLPEITEASRRAAANLGLAAH